MPGAMFRLGKKKKNVWDLPLPVNAERKEINCRSEIQGTTKSAQERKRRLDELKLKRLFKKKGWTK